MIKYKKKDNFIRPSFITADEIVRHHWAMQYPIEQTMKELQEKGFLVNKVAIIETWLQLDSFIDVV